MPWNTPGAVAVSIEQCRAWAGCGARLKAAIAPSATAATSNLLMEHSSLRFQTVRGFSHRLHPTPHQICCPASLGSLAKASTSPKQNQEARHVQVRVQVITDIG